MDKMDKMQAYLLDFVRCTYCGIPALDEGLGGLGRVSVRGRFI